MLQYYCISFLDFYDCYFFLIFVSFFYLIDSLIRLFTYLFSFCDGRGSWCQQKTHARTGTTVAEDNAAWQSYDTLCWLQSTRSSSVFHNSTSRTRKYGTFLKMKFVCARITQESAKFKHTAGALPLKLTKELRISY